IANGQLFDSQAFYGEPLYAFVLGALFRLGGVHLFFISALQGVLDAVTGVLIFRVALLAFTHSRRQAIWIGTSAALGWALFVPAAGYCGFLLSVFWIVTAWWFCVWWLLQRRACASLLEWFIVSLVIALMAMMSATILSLIPLLFAGVFATSRRKK